MAWYKQLDNWFPINRELTTRIPWRSVAGNHSHLQLAFLGEAWQGITLQKSSYTCEYREFENLNMLGTSLAVQWLRLQAPKQRAWVQFPVGAPESTQRN